ncbi:MAG TPA: hypothetical protein VHJ56_09625, partial [Candidatus Binatia bacterium]|nr:hypothetical protein [Candidatus Binatia bacterium]
MGEDSLFGVGHHSRRRASPFAKYSYGVPRTWLKLIAWAAAEGLALETLPSDRAGEFYKEATRDRSA